MLRKGSLQAFIAGPRFMPVLIVTAVLMLMMVTAGYGTARNSRICATIILLFAAAMVSVGFFAFHALVPGAFGGGAMFLEICLFGVALGGLRAVLLLRGRHLASTKADMADLTS
jgi:hypothetical protein